MAPPRCGPFRALRYAFEVRGVDAEVIAHVGHVLGDLAAGDGGGGPRSVYDLRRGADGHWCLVAGGVPVTRTRSAGRAVSSLLWHVNRQAVARTDDRVLLHAAVVARDGTGVVLPAAMEAGKTTLTAALVRAGYGYLSDELAAIDPDTGLVEAYPKPLSIDAGSWSVLAALRPDLPPPLVASTAAQWHVPASDVPGGRVVATVRPRLLVWPRYERGAQTRLEPLPPAMMASHLVGQAFHLGRRVARDFHVLTRLADRCPGYRLTVGSLEDARAALDAAVDGAGSVPDGDPPGLAVAASSGDG